MKHSGMGWALCALLGAAGVAHGQKPDDVPYPVFDGSRGAQPVALREVSIGPGRKWWTLRGHEGPDVQVVFGDISRSGVAEPRQLAEAIRDAFALVPPIVTRSLPPGVHLFASDFAIPDDTLQAGRLDLTRLDGQGWMFGDEIPQWGVTATAEIWLKKADGGSQQSLTSSLIHEFAHLIDHAALEAGSKHREQWKKWRDNKTFVTDYAARNNNNEHIPGENFAETLPWVLAAWEGRLTSAQWRHLRETMNDDCTDDQGQRIAGCQTEWTWWSRELRKAAVSMDGRILGPPVPPRKRLATFDAGPPEGF